MIGGEKKKKKGKEEGSQANGVEENAAINMAGPTTWALRGK